MKTDEPMMEGSDDDLSDLSKQFQPHLSNIQPTEFPFFIQLYLETLILQLARNRAYGAIWWISYDTPKRSERHHCPSYKWCMPQCWTGTNLTAHYWREVYITTLLTPRMELVLTSRHRDSGKMTDSMHFSMLGFSMPSSHTPIVNSHSPPATDEMIKKRRGSMTSILEKWSMVAFTPHFLSLRRDGSYCQSGVQEAGINDCKHNQSYS